MLWEIGSKARTVELLHLEERREESVGHLQAIHKPRQRQQLGRFVDLSPHFLQGLRDTRLWRVPIEVFAVHWWEKHSQSFACSWDHTKQEESQIQGIEEVFAWEVGVLGHDHQEKQQKGWREHGSNQQNEIWDCRIEDKRQKFQPERVFIVRQETPIAYHSLYVWTHLPWLLCGIRGWRQAKMPQVLNA